MSGRTKIKNPKALGNLIQQEDCIEIILQIIKKDVWNTTLNAAHPEHPIKEKYLKAPEFDQNGVSKGKKISSVELKEVLGFEYTGHI